MYKAIGHTERMDQTDFVRWFANEGPYSNVIDNSRISVFGWSYGGFTTTHIIGYGGGGEGKVFTSGVAGSVFETSNKSISTCRGKVAQLLLFSEK